jgi:hypothetical protein
MRDKLEAGTVLVAKYKGAEHRAEVVAGEDGKMLFRLADGRQFKSPSSAASAVMGGIAANGWRFWSLEADTSTADAKRAPVKKARGGRKPKAAAEPAETHETEAPTEEAVTE